jgi:deoxyribodipyrimidine photolyase
MDERLDSLKSEMHIPKPADFLAYDQFMAVFRERTIAAYEQERDQMACRSRFSNIAIPLIYGSLEASIREWQLRNEVAEEETELLEDIEEISGS